MEKKDIFGYGSPIVSENNISLYGSESDEFSNISILPPSNVIPKYTPKSNYISNDAYFGKPSYSGSYNYNIPNVPAYSIVINTYEINGNEENLVLGHIFYGNTLSEAISIAQSHLITDLFYSSGFTGSLPWRGAILNLINRGMIMESYNVPIEELSEIMSQLESNAHSIQKEQKEKKMDKIVENLSFHKFY